MPHSTAARIACGFFAAALAVGTVFAALDHVGYTVLAWCIGVIPLLVTVSLLERSATDTKAETRRMYRSMGTISVLVGVLSALLYVVTAAVPSLSAHQEVLFLTVTLVILGWPLVQSAR